MSQWMSLKAMHRQMFCFGQKFLVKDQITVFAARAMRMHKIPFTVANFDIYFHKFVLRFGYGYTKYQGKYSQCFFGSFVNPEDSIIQEIKYGHCIDVCVDFDIVRQREKEFYRIEAEKKEAERKRIHDILHPPPPPVWCECKGCGKTVKYSSLKPCYIRGHEDNGYKCISCWNKIKPLSKLVNEIYEIKSLTNKLQKLIKEKTNGNRTKEKHNRSASQNIA